MAGVALAAWTAPGSAPARVNPLHIIQQQIQKPNMLILFDTSGSMNLLPNAPDMDMHEAGMDCDGGDEYCRTVGKRGRCYMTMSGQNGPGRVNDTTSCTQDSDCTQAGVCRAGGASCTSNDQCADATCGWVANNFCVLTDPPVPPPRIQMCQLGLGMCRQQSDCNAIPGDTCGPATSRLLIAKRVLKQVVQEFHEMVNFGFMTFRQTGYYPYFKAVGAVTNVTRPAFLGRAELEFAGCFSVTTGPGATCTINHTTYTLAAGDNSRYRVNRGTSHQTQDASWGSCGELCAFPAVGTGLYIGSHYTYSFATAGMGTRKTFTDYVGRTRLDGGDTYVYLDAPPTKRNVDNIFGNELDDDLLYGISYNNASGIWDPNRVDFMDTSLALPLSSAVNMARKISAQADKVSLGGLYPYGGTPSGNALRASGVDAVKERSAYHYLEYVKQQNASNGVSCRPSAVLFITDGRPGNGDVNCDHADCGLSPPGAGCTCTAVLNARAIRETLGATVYVVGFSGTLAPAADRKSINHIAKAGGSTAYPPGCVGAACNYAYFATREADLKTAMTSAIYDAARGSYSTSPATSSSGFQDSAGTITAGSMLLDSRADFPSWKGNLIAYDFSGTVPTLAWSASSVAFDAGADPDFWKKRNVWTSETAGGTTTMIKIQVDQGTGAILNKSKLTSLGLGANDAESELVARWMLGDPALGNPAVLGAIVNSTPIDVGPPGRSPLPGGDVFFNGTARTRPFLTYVGASDGMLHAFFSKDATVGNRSYLAGQEAFAYIPQDMLKVVKRLFVQGGQLPGPQDHIYGLASSPKVKNLCTANCNDGPTAEWKTLLIMTEGYGGNDAFVLDISEPHTTTGIRDGAGDPPIRRVEWHTEYLSSSTQKSDYDTRLGRTVSVPAFYLNNTEALDDYRVVFASGYGDGTSADQGQYIVSAKATTGEPIAWERPTSVANCAAYPGLERALLTDVATSRRFGAGENAQLAAAYFGDPWGQLWRYNPKAATDRISDVAQFGCTHPLHFAPAVVQLDRDIAANHPREIYLVQVTNSALDPVTAYPLYPASKLIFRADKLDGDDVASATFAGGVTEVVRTVGVNSEICAVTAAGGTTCTTGMPANARPTATPMAVLKGDGTGFQVISLWYVPGPGGCTKGTTYLTIHELLISTGIVRQKYGGWLADEPVTSAVFIGSKLVFADAGGARDISNYGGMPGFTPPALMGPTSSERMRQLTWLEVP